MDRFDPKPELDAGAAAVALQPDIIARQPDIAASWAESITDAKLRSTTLAQVLRTEWSGKDPAAALNYARNSSVLEPGDRTTLLNDLASRPIERPMKINGALFSFGGPVFRRAAVP